MRKVFISTGGFKSISAIDAIKNLKKKKFLKLNFLEENISIKKT